MGIEWLSHPEKVISGHSDACSFKEACIMCVLSKTQLKVFDFTEV